MKSRLNPPSRAESRAKVKKLKLELAGAHKRAEAARSRAQAAKASFKAARRSFRKAKKLAKAARKKLRALKKALTLATQVAPKRPAPRQAKRAGASKAAAPNPALSRRAKTPAKKTVAEKRPKLRVLRPVESERRLSPAPEAPAASTVPTPDPLPETMAVDIGPPPATETT